MILGLGFKPNRIHFSLHIQDQFLRTTDSADLNIDISDLNLGTLKKAFNYARTRLKVRWRSSQRRLGEPLRQSTPQRSNNPRSYRQDLMQTF